MLYTSWGIGYPLDAGVDAIGDRGGLRGILVEYALFSFLHLTEQSKTLFQERINERLESPKLIGQL